MDVAGQKRGLQAAMYSVQDDSHRDEDRRWTHITVLDCTCGKGLDMMMSGKGTRGWRHLACVRCQQPARSLQSMVSTRAHMSVTGIPQLRHQHCLLWSSRAARTSVGVDARDGSCHCCATEDEHGRDEDVSGEGKDHEDQVCRLAPAHANDLQHCTSMDDACRM